MILLSIFLNQLYFYVKTLGLKNVSNEFNKFLRDLRVLRGEKILNLMALGAQ